MSRLPVTLFTALAASALVLACTVTTTPSPNDNTSSSGGNRDAGSSSGSSGSSGDAGGTGDDSRCVDEGAACVDCCAGAHPKGEDVFDAAAIACACGAEGVCQAECADTACATPATDVPEDSPCQTCLLAAFAQDGACFEEQDTACSVDADCTALVQCVGRCP